MRKLFIFCCALASVAVAQPVLAQQLSESLTNPQLAIELSPEYPRPGETVTATLNDYSGGTYGSTVSWVFNGDVIVEAENSRSATFTAGPAGSRQQVQVVLAKPNGGREVLNRFIQPMYLDIIIEPQTRTPDFYQGRSLPSIGSTVNATALVSTADSILGSDLVYTWSLNRKMLEGGPVRGLRQVSFEMPMGSSHVLSVQVTEPSGEVLARRSFLIPSVLPEVYFYEVSSLFGVDPRAISREYSLVGNSTTIKAEPFHLDTRVYNNPDIVEWEVDGQQSSSGSGNPYEVTIQRLRVTGGARLDFHVRDTTTQILQGAEGNIQINF